MNKTPFDKGMDSGRVIGREQNMRDVTIALLESKYRAVPKPYLERIGSLGYDDLMALVVRIPNAASMESLFSIS